MLYVPMEYCFFLPSILNLTPLALQHDVQIAGGRAGHVGHPDSSPCDVPLQGASGMFLPPCTLARIFNGNISTWDHPEITGPNPSLIMPAEPISVVRRQGASSSSYAISHYLNRSVHQG